MQINFMKNLNDNIKSVTICVFCGSKLAEAKVEKISHYKDAMQTQKCLEQILTDGYLYLCNQYIYSFHFFDTITFICKYILIYKFTKGIEHYPEFKLIKNTLSIKYSSTQPILKKISLKEQFGVLAIALRLFENYPVSLSSFLIKNNASKGQLIRRHTYVPFWYSTFLDIHLPRVPKCTRSTSEEEIVNAINYLKKLGCKRINLAEFDRLFDTTFTDSKYLKRLIKKNIKLYAHNYHFF